MRFNSEETADLKQRQIESKIVSIPLYVRHIIEKFPDCENQMELQKNYIRDRNHLLKEIAEILKVPDDITKILGHVVVIKHRAAFFEERFEELNNKYNSKIHSLQESKKHADTMISKQGQVNAQLRQENSDLAHRLERLKSTSLFSLVWRRIVGKKD